jgi:hypothetical protein
MLCLQWDPTTGRYGLAILSALRIAGVLTALGIAAFVAVMLRRELRGRAAGPTARPGAGVH